jgi:hypothetical protein
LGIEILLSLFVFFPQSLTSTCLVLTLSAVDLDGSRVSVLTYKTLDDSRVHFDAVELATIVILFIRGGLSIIPLTPNLGSLVSKIPRN